MAFILIVPVFDAELTADRSSSSNVPQKVFNYVNWDCEGFPFHIELFHWFECLKWGWKVGRFNYHKVRSFVKTLLLKERQAILHNLMFFKICWRTKESNKTYTVKKSLHLVHMFGIYKTCWGRFPNDVSVTLCVASLSSPLWEAAGLVRGQR